MLKSRRLTVEEIPGAAYTPIVADPSENSSDQLTTTEDVRTQM